MGIRRVTKAELEFSADSAGNSANISLVACSQNGQNGTSDHGNEQRDARIDPEREQTVSGRTGKEIAEYAREVKLGPISLAKELVTLSAWIRDKIDRMPLTRTAERIELIKILGQTASALGDASKARPRPIAKSRAKVKTAETNVGNSVGDLLR